MRRVCVALFLAVLLAGGSLRFWRLSAVPPGLYCDEAFQGYEAYCLIKTGADSRGVTTPLFFDVFGAGWEEPLYIYLTTIPVALLGTTEAAARAVAAAAGTLDLIAVAGVALALGGGRAALAAAAMMAFSPWAFPTSRVGFQATLLPLLLAAGAAALLKGGADEASGARDNVSKSSRPAPAAQVPGAGFGYLLLGASLITLALYTYVAAKLVVPILLLAFVLCFHRRIGRLGLMRRGLLAAAVALIALPNLVFTLTPGTQTRAADVGIVGNYFGLDLIREFFGNLAGYFTPAYLLTHGDPILRHQVRGFGELHPHEVLFLLAGVVVALRRRLPADGFVLSWMIAGALPAALSIEQMHSIRSIAMMPSLYALAGSGAAALVVPGGVVDPRTWRGRVVLAAVLVCATIAAGGYLHHYFDVYPGDSAAFWQFGLKQAFQLAMTHVGKHDAIYVTPKETSAYIHRLYLFGFPPDEFQKSGFTRTKYFFDPPPWDSSGHVPGMKDPIFILKPDEKPGGSVSRRFVVLYPNGTPAYNISW